MKKALRKIIAPILVGASLFVNNANADPMPLEYFEHAKQYATENGRTTQITNDAKEQMMKFNEMNGRFYVPRPLGVHFYVNEKHLEDTVRFGDCYTAISDGSIPPMGKGDKYVVGEAFVGFKNCEQNPTDGEST